jgi:hypothetical protein
MSRCGTAVSLICLCFFSLCSVGQSIDNVQAVFTDKKVLINYDLNGKSEEKYSIRIFGSHNSFSTPLRLVSGAVGDGITAGKAKTIEWHVADELTSFRGQITFKLKGEVMAAPLMLQSPAANGTMRTGKKFDIKWTGGRKTEQVKLELLQDGKVFKTVGEGANTGTFSWTVPKDIAKGTYTVRATSGSESVTSGSVVVKSPLPLWVKLSPIVVAGILVFILLPDDPEPPPVTPDTDLPNAPRPN